MPSIEVPGATLHYESFGKGPLLLLIPGAQGTGAIFYDLAKLIPSFTVICLTRRGYSQSLIVGSQDFNNRLSIDANDAHLLIQKLSAEPVVVLGSSSGAVVAQRLLELHPESVKKLISHEPPSLFVLPEEIRTQATGLLEHVYATYRANGTISAMEVFSNGLFDENDAVILRTAMDPARGDEVRANTMFWFEFELRQYTSAPVNLDLLVAEKEKFIPAAGVLSKNGPCLGPISIMAQKMGKEVVKLPGAHLGYETEVEAFAEALLDLLK
ncbi:hypothetical protein HYFRA_00007944 [Hymenoscyphus fraxineus]|uniref:AB hydrolase-1 domain-containing protein n=1 Tax=Hymenoscyphus fraxineus TaxID=746836 RepID=A0A9N9KSF7_9HELO|nr:hypothetical protein HYFRA_00007944 [Hymenoscyphus fraxineus]